MSNVGWIVFSILFYAAMIVLVVSAQWLLTPEQLSDAVIWLVYAVTIGTVISTVLVVRSLMGKK